MSPAGLVSAADHRVFVLLNGVWTARWLDASMPVITDLHHEPVVRYVLAPLAAAAFLARKRLQGVKVLAALSVLVFACDFAAHRVLKPLVHRERPEHHAGLPVALREDLHTGYSFPSNHAVNMFASAAFLGAIYPAAAAPLFAAAAIVGYSRVYVGVHFPFDVLGGALFGALCGWAAARLLRRLRIL